MGIFTKFFFVVCFLKSVTISGTLLTAKLSKSRLPTERYGTRAVYDGTDYVYIFFGITKSYRTPDEILKYSIHSESIEVVGKLPHGIVGSSLAVDENGFIYFIGGYQNQRFLKTIQRFNPKTKQTATVSELPTPNGWSALVQSDSKTAFIFGGGADSSGIVKFDLNTLKASSIGKLPYFFRTVAAVYDNNTGSAIIFGYGNEVVKYSIMLNESTVFLGHDFPMLWTDPSAVWNGKSAFIIGGNGIGQVSINVTKMPTDGIIQFSPMMPKSQQIKFLHVENYPCHDDIKLSYASAVYVNRQNRIYIFGGNTFNNTRNLIRDEIWYIDLDPKVKNISSELPNSFVLVMITLITQTTLILFLL